MITNTMQRVGKGAFSTVYRKSKRKVLIKSVDRAKECMSLGWFPNTPLFPKVEHIATSACGSFRFYEQRYYPRGLNLKYSLTPFEYEFYQALRHIPYYRRSTYTFPAAVDELPNKFAHKKEALKDAFTALCNFGCPHFEISPRNVAVQNGKLVLLDCFFF